MMEIATIPRTIHYCWFGRKEKPELIKACIASWEKRAPGYDIVEWNEARFDIESVPYVREAYRSGKYAFVSDYVRAYALYRFGGIYLDTDVELFRSFDDLLHHDSFWGFEQGHFIATSTIGASPGNALIKQFLDAYEGKRFVKEDGTCDDSTNVALITSILAEKGLRPNGEYQELAGLGAFYPQMYFSPYDYINCRNLSTPETYAIHYFHKSWIPWRVRMKSNVKLALSKVIGGENIYRLRSWLAGRSTDRSRIG